MKNKILFTLALIAFTSAVKAQNGYQSLFDGKTLNGWKRLAGTADYKVVNGQIVGTSVAGSGNTFLVTEKEYGDFVLELDAKIDSPKSNSGIQVRSHYNPAGHEGKGLVYGKQCEIDPSARKWSGGIYDEGRREWLYPMDLNEKEKDAFKVGVYNHIKIECIGDEMKVWVNNIATAYVIDTLDRTGFIGLQVHAVQKPEDAGEKVYFKNIRIKTTGIKPQPFAKDVYVTNLKPNALNSYEKENGWKLLFDGSTPKGWRSTKNMQFPDKGWDTKNGALTVSKNPEKEEPTGGDIIADEKYGAFDLSFEWKATPVANSGVKYFVNLSNGATGSALGLEYQILDDDRHPDAKLGRDGDRKLGSLYDILPANKQPRFVRPIGVWSVSRIVVYPNGHAEHFLNGVKILDYDRNSAAYKEAVALSKFKNDKGFAEGKEGYLLIQDHGCEVSYRSIKIKRLD